MVVAGVSAITEPSGGATFRVSSASRPPVPGRLSMMMVGA
jgi:hypothetical protein